MFNNLLNLTKLIGIINAQEWFDNEYPYKKREKIKSLNIYLKFLEGELVVKDFPNLERIACSNNSLTKLTIINCPKVDFLNCGYNRLNNLEFLNELNLEKLDNLSVEGNSFSPQDLSVFSKFINLRNLDVGGNAFYGSLKPLQDLKKLERLHIYYDTEGLEYLPDNLKKIYCGGKLAEQLKGYARKDDKGAEYYDYQAWKKDKLVNSLEEENVKIEGLEDDIIHLTNLAKKQRKKIVEAYLKFTPEKELLRDLINTCLEYNKFRKKKLSTAGLRKKFNKLHEKLETKVGEEFIEKIETILTDCDELVDLEIKLEKEITKRKLLLEEAYQKAISISVNISGSVTAKAGSSVIIGNIIKNYTEKKDYQSEISLTEMLEKEEKNKIITTNYGIINGERIIIGNSFTGQNDLGTNYTNNNYANINKGGMVNWVNIHHDFADENLIRQWINHGFNYQNTQELYNAFGDNFNPHEHDFYSWLRNIRKLTSEQCLNFHNLAELKTEYNQQWLITINNQKEAINQEIKTIEEHLKNYYETPKLVSVELIKKFIDSNKKLIKDENDKVSRKETKELRNLLKEKENFSDEDIEEIIRGCEKIIDLEWQIEQLNKSDSEQNHFFWSECEQEEIYQKQIQLTPKIY